MMMIEDVSGGQHENQTHQAKEDSILNAPRDVQAAKFSTLLHFVRSQRPEVRHAGLVTSSAKAELAFPL